jgi:hypothetical protein
MNGAVLNYVFKTNINTKKHFSGFSSPDLPLPKLKRFPTIIILNTDKANGPGEHWCLLFVKSKRKADFFDPYGNPPTYYNFDKPIFDKLDDVVYSDSCVQGITPTCGHHCIFFSIQRARGHSMEHILKKMYSKNLWKNDRMVYNFVKNSYGDDFASFNF